MSADQTAASVSTPRTDALYDLPARVARQYGYGAEELCRTLERENAALVAHVEDAERRAAYWADCTRKLGMNGHELETKLTALRSENARLCEALHDAASYVENLAGRDNSCDPGCDEELSEWRNLIAAHAALKAGGA